MQAPKSNRLDTFKIERNAFHSNNWFLNLFRHPRYSQAGERRQPQSPSPAAARAVYGFGICITDPHRGGYGKRFIVRADEMLTAFVELQTGDTRVRGEFDLVTDAQKRASG